VWYGHAFGYPDDERHPRDEEETVPEDCVILDLPEGLRLNLLGLIVQIDRILITADRAGLLGGLLASLTCGGVESADRLEALAQMIRSQEQPAP
jgi:hypothetical protein